MTEKRSSDQAQPKKGKSEGKSSLRSLTHAYARLWPYVRRHRASLLRAGGLTVLIILADLVRPWPIKVVIDQVILGQPWSTLPASWQGPEQKEWLLYGSALALIAITGMGAALAYLRTVLLAQAGHDVVARVRKDVHAHLLNLPLSYHDTHKRGDLLVRLTGDAAMLKVLLIEGVFFLGQEAFTFLGVAAVMFVLDPGLTALALLTVPTVAWLVYNVGSRLKATARKQRQKEALIANVASDTLWSIPTIQAYNLQHRATSFFRKQNKKSAKAGVAAARLEAFMERWTQLAIALGTAVVLAAGGRSVLHGTMSPGVLVVMISYVRTLYKPLRRFATRSAKIFKASAGGDRILQILDTPIRITSGKRPRAVVHPRGRVEFQGVTFRYGNDEPVLNGIDLSIQPGEHVAFIGQNGAGKSTLLSLVPRLRDPSSGRVLFDGHDVRGYDPADLRKRVGVLFQNAALMEGTILDNVLFGAESPSSRQVDAALELSGLHKIARSLPHGVDTQVGEAGGRLSGGQLQRVALARALVRSPAVLILDEPSNSLDPEASSMLIERVLPELRKTTVLMVTHDPPLVEAMDRAVRLGAGKVTDDDSPSKVLGTAGTIPIWRAARSQG